MLHTFDGKLFNSSIYWSYLLCMVRVVMVNVKKKRSLRNWWCEPLNDAVRLLNDDQSLPEVVGGCLVTRLLRGRGLDDCWQTWKARSTLQQESSYALVPLRRWSRNRDWSMASKKESKMQKWMQGERTKGRNSEFILGWCYPCLSTRFLTANETY